MTNTMVQKVFRQMSAAQIVSAVTVTICLLIDSIMIGRFLGVDAMSAYGLANPVLIIFNAIGTMASCGVQILLGKAMGRGDANELKRCYSTSIVMSIAIAAAWMLFIFTASKPLCTMLGAGSPSPDNPVFSMTSDYLKGYILGAPFFLLSQTMVPYLQAIGKRRLTVLSVAAMTVADIIFDILSVYVFHAGMFGIGLASGVSYLVATLVGIGYFLSKDCMFIFDRKSADLKTAGAIAYGGNPIILNQAFFTIRMYCLNHILLSAAGTVAVATLSVVSTVGNIIFSIGLGTGSIALMLASIFYNEEDRSSIHELLVVMPLFSLELMLAALAIVHLFAPQIIDAFFAGDARVAEIAVSALRIYLISMIACVLTQVYKCYYQGVRQMKFTNYISFVDNVGLLIPITWAFGKLMGLRGVWIGITVAQFGTLLFIAAFVWYKYGRISFSTDAFGMLGKDFGAAAADVFEGTITDMDTAIEASRDINSFCKEKGLGDRLSMLISLCVEEILANIVNFGFNSDDKEHNAEVRLVVHPDRCIVRIRDNCIGFDPTRYFELHKSDSPTEHIGLRMVMSMTSEVDYINTLGLNNLYMSVDR